LPSKKDELSKLEAKMTQPGFWDNPDAAQATVGRLSGLKSLVEPVDEIYREVHDVIELYELAVDDADERIAVF